MDRAPSGPALLADAAAGALIRATHAHRVIDLADLPVVDDHAHPLLADPSAVTADGFAELFSEGRPPTMAAHVPHTSYFRRAVHGFADRLGVAPTIDAILHRRRELGDVAAADTLRASRVEQLLIDTGYPPDAMPLDTMRRVLPCAVHEVFRVETCAERLLSAGTSFDAFVERFRGELRDAARRSVALKSIVAYRSGLAIEAWRREDVVAAYDRAVGRARAGVPRLSDKPLLDELFRITLETCRDTGRPLQLHAGFGDPDIDLLQANPLLLRPLLEDARWRDVRFVVLHFAYPYTREAAFMTAVWPNVHLDLSLAFPFLGAGMVGPLIEALSLAPSTKLLYGSDVRALPELFAFAADWARAALAEALGWLGTRERWSDGETRAVAARILAENARALYGLPRPA